MARPPARPSRPPAGAPEAQAPAAAARAAPPSQAQTERDRRLADCLAACAAGDSSSFDAFYSATFAYARTVARRLLRGDADVEDLLADCYFEAWRNAARFDPRRGSAVTWLLTLVRSRGVDALRAAAARRAVPHDGDAAGAAPACQDAVSTTSVDGSPCASELAAHAAAAPGSADARIGADPAEALWRRQSGAALHAALGTLSGPERWVLGLAYLRELSHAEIARCTGMPLGSVKSHALRAQAKLRQHFLGHPLSGAAAATDTAAPSRPHP